MSDWLASLWGRLPSGPKLLLIMVAALLPLGVVAVIASVHNARVNSEQRIADTLARLDRKTARLDNLVVRTMAALRGAGIASDAGAAGEPGCRQALARLASEVPAQGRFALLGADRRSRCASPGFAPLLPATGLDADRDFVELDPAGESLRMLVTGPLGRVRGVAEFSRAALRDLTYLPGTTTNFDLDLLGGGRRMVLREEYSPATMARTLTDTERVGVGPLQLRITLSATPLTLVDALLIVLPVMMWLAAGLIAWWVVNQQLVRPLGRIQQAVTSYRPGDRALRLPPLKSPAREIGELGHAFDALTRTVASHESELEAAVDRQTMLVREVHHRVKNNLQVVASLLNLHSRSSASEESAAAYASIQRRVEALAVVHRNHFAEIEETRGIALKPLIAELATNLRATAPAKAALMAIRIDVAPFFVSQDIAASVAFLITEVTEYAMLRGADAVSIILEGAGPGKAQLTIEAEAISGKVAQDPEVNERFERIITGLARKLRSPLEADPEQVSYSVTLAVRGEQDSS
ncbi:MAG: sensor histidine kinase [Sphingosinicella sp.]